MKLGIALLFALLLLVAPTTSADTVVLKDGSTLEGIVIKETAETITLKLRYATMPIPVEEVERIERGVTRDQTLDRMLAAVDRASPNALKEIAVWARKNGLASRARALEKQAADLVFNRLLSSVDENDPEALYGLSLSLRKQDFNDQRIHQILNLVLAADPDHERAHKGLGHTHIDGKWVNDKELEAIQKEHFEKDMMKKGFVRYKGDWVNPDGKLFLDRMADFEKKEKALEDREKSLDRDQSDLDRQRKDLRRREDDLLAKETRLRDGEKRLEREKDDWERRRRLLGGYHSYHVTCPKCHKAFKYRGRIPGYGY